MSSGSGSGVEKKVRLKCSDGEIFKVEETVALESNSIKKKMEKAGHADEVIDLENVSSVVLSKVLDFCRKYVEARRESKEDELKQLRTDFLQRWLMKKDGDLRSDAKYLEIMSLVEFIDQQFELVSAAKQKQEQEEEFQEEEEEFQGQLFWQQSRGSPEYSQTPSPRMTSPGPSSRIQSGAVTPIDSRAGGAAIESQTSWVDDGKQQSYGLPLPPITISNASPFSHSNSAAISPPVPRSPGRAENPVSPESQWKKGILLGRGTCGHVFLGFNSDSGEMCAMKEVTLFDDTKSQLMQEIALLSRLRHPNIVQYYGSETVGDKLCLYLEYVSGGSICKLLRDYGQFGELTIRSYTQQILTGLAYLHSKQTVHRDIKGTNILVDQDGRVKLADFGMAKHIIVQSLPLSFKGSPHWMAPEVIKNSNVCNLAVDIWSLGCTVLEMATTKPPWSQFEGVAAIFKIANSKELPTIPDHLTEDGKDFIRKCLQRNPANRPTAAELLEHPFVKYAAHLERPIDAEFQVDLEKMFVIINFVLELPSAAFDQLSSVHKPQYAIMSMSLSFVAMFLCIVELVHKCQKEEVSWKWRSILPWLYYPPRNHSKPFGNFKDIIGLICAIFQCTFATINFYFARQHSDNPVKISFWPIIFALGLLCSKFLEKPVIRRRRGLERRE